MPGKLFDRIPPPNLPLIGGGTDPVRCVVGDTPLLPPLSGGRPGGDCFGSRDRQCRALGSSPRVTFGGWVGHLRQPPSWFEASLRCAPHHEGCERVVA